MEYAMIGLIVGSLALVIAIVLLVMYITHSADEDPHHDPEPEPIPSPTTLDLPFKSYTTVERDAITDLEAGLVVFNTTTNTLQTYNGTEWVDYVPNPGQIPADTPYRYSLNANATGITAADLINDMCWSPSLGLFLAVGNNQQLATSPNGTTWTERSTAHSMTANINTCVWVESLSKFIIGGDNGEISSSGDGMTWSALANGTAAGTTIVSLAFGNGVLVAVGSGLADNEVFTSTNGTTWTIRATGNVERQFSGVTYSTGSVFVASATNATNGGVFRSTDSGSTWSATTTALDPADIWSSVAWSPTLTRFVAVATNTGHVAWSTDGDTWVDDNTILSVNIDKIRWVHDRFIGLHTANGHLIFESFDGYNQHLILTGTNQTTGGMGIVYHPPTKSVYSLRSEHGVVVGTVPLNDI